MRDPAVPQFLSYGVAITFCDVNPELYAMLTNQTTVLDPDGNAVGFRVNSQRSPVDTAFALEVWSNVPGVACDDPNAAGSYGYTLLPFVTGGVIGGFTLENNAVSFSITNATTKDGTNWGQGPYDVVPQTGGVAGPLLTALDSYDHLHVQYTTIAPPEASCDCLPSGPDSTGATAGSPGTWTPTDSVPPADFASITGITASPATAWTTGQYVILEDDSHAYWDGSDWQVGEAP